MKWEPEEGLGCGQGDVTDTLRNLFPTLSEKKSNLDSNLV